MTTAFTLDRAHLILNTHFTLVGTFIICMQCGGPYDAKIFYLLLFDENLWLVLEKLRVKYQRLGLAGWGGVSLYFRTCSGTCGGYTCTVVCTIHICSSVGKN